MEHKVYNLKKLRAICGDDENFINEMIVTFIENVSTAIEKIQQLKPTEDWKTIGEISHKLASNFGYLCADVLYNIADNIEKSILIENDITNINEKTEQLISESFSLLDILRKDFKIS